MNKNYKVFIRTLGCPKNEVDSLYIAGELSKNGFEVIDKLSQADAVILNTCGFLEDARMESLEELNFFIGLKEVNLIKKILVTGCYAQRSANWFVKTFSGIDGVVGNRDLKMIPIALNKIFNGESKVIETPSTFSEWYSEGTFLPSTFPFAYVKISEGCSNACSYCALPNIRGKARSLPIEKIIEQTNNLIDLGFKEIILVAQDTPLYGNDLYGKPSLSNLINEILKKDKDFWLRLLYVNPMHFDMNIINIMKEDDRLVHYLDLPIQHTSQNVLTSMNRKVNADEQKDLIRYIKDEVPDIALRSTLLVGFPGETDDDFAELVSYVEEGWFDHLGVFTYSNEEGTKAYDMQNQVPKSSAELRYDVLNVTIDEINSKKMNSLVGKKFPVLIESEKHKLLEGRLAYDAPQIDRIVVVKGEANTGEFLDVKINGYKGFTLYAESTE